MDIAYAVKQAHEKTEQVIAILNSEVEDSVKISIAWGTQRHDKEFVSQVAYLGLHTNDFIIESNKHLEPYTRVDKFKDAYEWLLEQLTAMDTALG